MPGMSSIRRSKPSTSSRDPKKIAFWAFIAVAIVAAAGMYWAADRRQPETTDYASAYVPAEPAVYDRLPVTILGDSYTVGVGAPQGQGYAQNVRRRFCWNLSLQGQSGTGYSNAGPQGEGYRTFPDRVADATANSPALIIVQGSTNDTNRSDLAAQIDRTFGALRVAAPETPIIVVGPTAPPAVNAAAVIAVRDRLRTAAEAAGFEFIDPIALGWLTGPDRYSKDGLHPNENGHREYADKLIERLEQLGLPRLETCEPVN